MAPRRRAAAVVEPKEFDDPIQDVIDAQSSVTADTLADIFDDLATVAEPNSGVKVYKIASDGKFAWIKDLTPPVETKGLLEELRREWGGGDYVFRVYANKKIAGSSKISIAGDPNPIKKEQTANNDRLIEVMLQQANGSKSDLMAMMTMMNNQQQAAQNMMMQAGQQQMQMMMTMMTTLIPVMAGGKTDPLALVQAFASMNSDKPAPMSEMVATMAAMKDLMSDSGSSSDDGFFGGAAKALLPMLAKGVESQVNKQPNHPMNTLPVNHPDPVRALVMPPAMPSAMPKMAPSSIPPMPPMRFEQPSVTGAEELPVGEPINRVVALIKEDVLFLARREHDPAVAASLLLDVIEAAEVPENEIIELVVSFQSSQDWLGDLARQGVDLTAHRTWASRLLEELVKQYAETSEEHDDTEG